MYVVYKIEEIYGILWFILMKLKFLVGSEFYYL